MTLEIQHPRAPLTIHGFGLTKSGVVAPDGIAFEQWQALGEWLSFCDSALHWWIGDWLNYGERNYGETYTQAMGETGFGYQTLADDKWVAAAFELSDRSEKLTWTHHRVVASAPAPVRSRLLAKAEVEQLTVSQLRMLASHERQAVAIERAGALPEGKRRCVVIDPPWPVEKIEREERPKQGRELDYRGGVMGLDAIGAAVGRMVKDAAHEDGCHVYLWVTQKYLPAGLRFFLDWGVEYQCVMTWVKPTGMTPYSWMYNAEHVLFGRIGSLPLSRMGLKLTFEAPVSRHSAKPDVFYERVREASPEPRLSIYERREVPGFAVWGDEVPLGGEPS